MQLKDYYLVQDLDLVGKVVLLRLDLNLPVINQKIQDYTRLTATKEMIEYLLSKECKIVILSHFGRVKKLEDLKQKTLTPIAKVLSEEYPLNFIKFIPTNTGPLVVDAITKMSNGQIILLENTRHKDIDPEGNVISLESKNNVELAKEWAGLADVFVNDAFGLVHRTHASNVGIGSFIKQKGLGFLIQKEINNLVKVVNDVEKPLIGILGGAKISDKLKLIKKILNKVDFLLIGGAMVYTFMRAKNLNTGKSLVEESMIDECASLLKQYPEKIILPFDHIVNSEFVDQPGTIIKCHESDKWTGNMGFDIGPKSVKLFCSYLKKAKTVFWNGPMGVFEMVNYSHGTKNIINYLVSLTKEGQIYSLIGGGDTASVIVQTGVENDVSFVSTGGGATLTFLEGGDLPGVEIMKK